MYQITAQTETTRTYENKQTGSEVKTSLKHTDGDGNGWWAFDDLFAIPAIRKIASQKIAQLYGIGVSIGDLDEYFDKHIQTLRSEKLKGDDKYDNAIAETINLKTIVHQTADPVKQSLALCTVYVLSDEERIDHFSMHEAAEKMQQWALKPDVQAFFLSWWMDGINPYMNLLNRTSRTASMNQTNPTEV